MTRVLTPSRPLSVLGPILGLLFVFLLFLFLNKLTPPTTLDLRNVAVHTVIVATVGVGMTFVLISGGIDLSVGSAVALAGVAAALAAKADWNILGILAAALAAGLFCGLYNGLLIGALRLPAFIVTLGTLGFFRGVSKWIAKSEMVYGPTHGLELLMRPQPPGELWLVAPAAWIVLLLAFAGWAVLNFTVVGRQWVAMGDNPTAARYAAIPLRRRRVQVYVLAGGLVGIAGFLQFARITGGDPTISVGLELDVIAAAVIGGASLSGGAGSVWGTVCGAVMMAFLRNRCTALGWPNFVQEMIVGHIIIAAVALDILRRRGAALPGGA
jgi:ribose transport system permease protein